MPKKPHELLASHRQLTWKEREEARQWREIIRREAGVSQGRRGWRYPVDVIAGSSIAPVLTGEHGGWYTNGGSYIRHPGAYLRKGWSNARYRCSTLSVEVGENWEGFRR